MTAEARTEGTLLGGRVRYAQPAEGYRTGIEPVLLAACVPARAGERVLEAGCGSGAGLLCLLARVPGVAATGLELDGANAVRARDNLRDNGWDGLVLEGDVAAAARLGSFEHAMANPPWHDPASTLPIQPGRALAKHRGTGGLGAWIEPLALAVPGRRGTLSLVLPTARLGESLALLAGVGFGRTVVCPLWPRQGVPARLLLVQGRRGRSDTRLLPGMVLHGPEGYTEAAEQVLRQGAALPF